MYAQRDYAPGEPVAFFPATLSLLYHTIGYPMVNISDGSTDEAHRKGDLSYSDMTPEPAPFGWIVPEPARLGVPKRIFSIPFPATSANGATPTTLKSEISHVASSVRSFVRAADQRGDKAYLREVTDWSDVFTDTAVTANNEFLRYMPHIGLLEQDDATISMACAGMMHGAIEMCHLGDGIPWGMCFLQPRVKASLRCESGSHIYNAYAVAVVNTKRVIVDSTTDTDHTTVKPLPVEIGLMVYAHAELGIAKGKRLAIMVTNASCADPNLTFCTRFFSGPTLKQIMPTIDVWCRTALTYLYDIKEAAFEEMVNFKKRNKKHVGVHKIFKKTRDDLAWSQAKLGLPPDRKGLDSSVLLSSDYLRSMIEAFYHLTARAVPLLTRITDKAEVTARQDLLLDALDLFTTAVTVLGQCRPEDVYYPYPSMLLQILTVRGRIYASKDGMLQIPVSGLASAYRLSGDIPDGVAMLLGRMTSPSTLFASPPSFSAAAIAVKS